MSETPRRTLWLLSDGLPGHVNQARSIARLLCREYQLEVIEIPAIIRLKWLRPLLAFWLNCGWPAPSCFIERLYRTSLPVRKPALIISAGGNTSFLNAILGLQGHPNLFIGSLRRLDAKLFTIVFTLEPINTKNNVVMDVPPSLIDPEGLSAEAAKFHAQRTSTAPLFAMIIGGDGAGYVYSNRDWLDLVGSMVEISHSTGCRWLITTSRRTGESAEHILSTQLPAAILEDAVWYATSPRPVMRHFLAAAQRVFVTADSMSMLADSIASERPVIALRPRQAQPDKRFQNALQKFQDQGFLELFAIADAAKFQYTVNAAVSRAGVGQTLLSKIVPHLGMLI